MEASLGTPSKEIVMSRSYFRQTVAALVLLTLTGAPLTASAAPRRETVRLWGPSLEWISRMLAGRWTKEGCMIDPFGRCLPGTQQTTEEGCMIDPSGRCLDNPQPTMKEGCRIDPNGRCLPGE